MPTSESRDTSGLASRYMYASSLTSVGVMYSLNVPVPGAVSAFAWEIRSALTEFERLRDELTLVVKRLEARSAGEFAAEERVIRQELSGVAPFEIEITGLDMFDDPPAGPGPVLYLAVESPGVIALHEQLTTQFGALGNIEGASYVPHITIARGATESDNVDSILENYTYSYRWTVERLVFWDARREMPAGEVPLPA